MESCDTMFDVGGAEAGGKRARALSPIPGGPARNAALDAQVTIVDMDGGDGGMGSMCPGPGATGWPAIPAGQTAGGPPQQQPSPLRC
eukprot:gene39408-33543_t